MKNPKTAMKLHRFFYFLLGFWSLGILAIAAPTQASISNKGTEFWLAFPQGFGSITNPVTLQLLITSQNGATGQVQIPGLSFTASFTVAAGATTQIVVPAAAQVTQTDGIASLGIHVTSDNPISVNGFNYVQYASDGYTGLPVEALGTSYMVVAYVAVAVLLVGYAVSLVVRIRNLR